MLRFLLVPLSLASSQALALAQDAPKAPASTPSTTTPAAPQDTRPVARVVNVEAGSRTPDDDLVALAKAAHLNVLADAGDMDAASDSPAREGILYGQLNTLAKARHLTWLQSGPDTLLAWREPDALALAKQIADTMRVEKAAKVPPPGVPGVPFGVPGAPGVLLGSSAATTPKPPSLNEELVRFFAKRKNPGTKGDEQQVPVALLPEPLQGRVMDTLKGRNANAASAVDALWFSDDFWKGVHLRIQNLNMASPGPNGQLVTTPTPILFFGGPYATGGRRGVVMRGMAFVPSQK